MNRMFCLLLILFPLLAHAQNPAKKQDPGVSEEAGKKSLKSDKSTTPIPRDQDSADSKDQQPQLRLPFDPSIDGELRKLMRQVDKAEERLEKRQADLLEAYKSRYGEPGTSVSGDRGKEDWVGKPLVRRSTQAKKATLDWLYKRRRRMVERLIEQPNDKTRQTALDELDERIESLEEDLEQISSFRIAGPRTTSFIRFEYDQNRDLNHRINDNDFRIPARLDLGLSAVFAGVGKAFVLGTFSETFDAGTRARDFGEEPDIYEAYIELLLLRTSRYQLVPRIGRQALQFGSGRVLGRNRFQVFQRSFDAVLLNYQNSDFAVSGFLGRPVKRAEINDDQLNQADWRESLMGLYWQIFPEQPVEFDVFAVRKQTTRRVQGEDSPDLDTSTIFTFGAAVRILHKSGFGLEFEGMAQTGTNAGDFHESYSANGLVLKEWYWDPAPSDEGLPPDVIYSARRVPYLRLFAGFDWADGDRKPGDGRSQGFQPVYPSVHQFLGRADVLGQRNLLDLYGGLTLTWRSDPNHKGFSTISLTVTGHYFRVDERNDFNIDVNSQPLFAPGTPIGSGHVGQELDVELRLFNLVTVGYARFEPGPALRRRGLRDPVNYFYLNIGF